MAEEVTVNDLRFDRKDCTFSSATVDDIGSNRSRPPRVGGGTAGMIVNGKFDPDAARMVTVTHVPTGLSASVQKYHPARNKELAFQEVERLVNDFLTKMKKTHGQKN